MNGWIGFFLLVFLAGVCLYGYEQFHEKRKSFFLNNGFEEKTTLNTEYTELIKQFFKNMKIIEPFWEKEESDKYISYIILDSDADENSVSYSLIIVRYKKIEWNNYYLLKCNIWSKNYLNMIKKKENIASKFCTERVIAFDQAGWIGFKKEGFANDFFSEKIVRILKSAKGVEGFICYKKNLFLWADSSKYKQLYRLARQLIDTNNVS